jgi:hypothetical protein
MKSPEGKRTVMLKLSAVALCLTATASQGQSAPALYRVYDTPSITSSSAPSKAQKGAASKAQPVVAAAISVSVQQAASIHMHALDMALKGQTKAAISMLKSLEFAFVNAKPARPSELDAVEMSLGRLQYESGSFDAAIDSYSKVMHGGQRWLEALEEQAWAEMARGKPQAAIAKLKTVTSPLFKEKVKSEPYFLLGLAELRVCDYKELFATLDIFKNRFRERVKAMQADHSPSGKVKLAEVSETIQKLNLVEAEAMQRLYLDENGKHRSGSVPHVTKAYDQLSFPQDGRSDEVWMDELEGFQVTLKGCLAPQAKPQIARSKEMTDSKEATRAN